MNTDNVPEKTVVDPEPERKLIRGLQPRHLQLIVLGGIIGSGYFLGTGYVIERAGPAAALAYMLGGIIVFCVMLCLGELSVAAPVSGSFIHYATNFISPTWGCGVGWSYWLTWVAYVPSEMIAAGWIMNIFFPMVGAVWWSMLFAAIVTLINVGKVGAFGEIEFWLSLIKILAIMMFITIASCVYLGLIGSHPVDVPSIFSSTEAFFPKKPIAVLLTMVMVLVNFQGTEIVGIAAAESQEPRKVVPVVIRNIVWRIIFLYVVPLLLLVIIYPWQKVGIESSAFAEALGYYGFQWASGIFSFVILTAAISCSSSGLYSCSRAMWTLAREGMAPRWLSKLNHNNVPQNAALLSVTVCWIGILLNTLGGGFEEVYTKLLALSGFSGAITWISICWSQLKFRRKLIKNGHYDELKFKTPLFPYLTHFTIWIQVFCLVLMAFDKELVVSLYVGIPLLLLPMIWYKLWAKKKYGRNFHKLSHRPV
ncbi:MAG: amino acid permease-associated region [Chlamydiales bacterium]|jgi:AAT family amino acid transporter|nr:amino acid permease-associated region [Chlamydiales bacterium]